MPINRACRLDSRVAGNGRVGQHQQTTGSPRDEFRHLFRQNAPRKNCVMIFIAAWWDCARAGNNPL
jgi:hypothetical protein